jgi:hypothetical protein
MTPGRFDPSTAFLLSRGVIVEAFSIAHGNAPDGPCGGRWGWGDRFPGLVGGHL